MQWVHAAASAVVGLALALCAPPAEALPGNVPRDEADVIRAVVASETIVGETQKASEIQCTPAHANGLPCKLDAEFSRGIAAANAQRGYLQCRALGFAFERCVRRREVKRRVFHRYPAAMFSRPAFSADGRSAVVFRTRYASADRGRHEWVFLTRAGAGAPWTVTLEQLVGTF